MIYYVQAISLSHTKKARSERGLVLSDVRQPVCGNQERNHKECDLKSVAKKVTNLYNIFICIWL